MDTKDTQKIMSVVGLLVLVGLVAGFLMIVISGLPSSGYVSKNAHPIINLPEDFFSQSLTQKVGSLSVPNGLPVSPSASGVGRSNAFQGY